MQENVNSRNLATRWRALFVEENCCCSPRRTRFFFIVFLDVGGGGTLFLLLLLLGVSFGVILGVCARTEMFSSGGFMNCM